jgi:hypothetical protein
VASAEGVSSGEGSIEALHCGVRLMHAPDDRVEVELEVELALTLALALGLADIDAELEELCEGAE